MLYFFRKLFIAEHCFRVVFFLWYTYKNAVFAYQAGLGLDISKLTVDLRYEGNFSNQATLGNNEGEVRINQVMLSLGLKLL